MSAVTTITADTIATVTVITPDTAISMNMVVVTMVVVTAHITTVIAADTRMKKKATIQVTGTLPLMQAAQPIKGTSEVSKAALRAVSVMMPRGPG